MLRTEISSSERLTCMLRTEDFLFWAAKLRTMNRGRIPKISNLNASEEVFYVLSPIFMREKHFGYRSTYFSRTKIIDLTNLVYFMRMLTTLLHAVIQMLHQYAMQIIKSKSVCM